MNDIHPVAFKFKTSKSFCASSLWAAWLCMPSSVRLAVYHLLLKCATPTSSLRAYRLPFGFYIKYRYGTTVTETLAMQHVATHTTIPVPTVLDVLQDSKGEVFLLMTGLPGRDVATMGPGVMNTLSKDRALVFEEVLNNWFTQLRNIPPPPGHAVCGFLGTSFVSYRIATGERVGPFASQEEFHAQPFCTLRPDIEPEIHSLAVQSRAKGYRLCFTHGDISPNNILVDENCKPTGLVDWECAAWLPEYWEFTSAVVRRQKHTGWVETFSNIFPQYATELVVEKAIWRHHIPF